MHFYHFVSTVVFPTHVGVFLLGLLTPNQKKSLPHARGGVSTMIYEIEQQIESSPRTWGCFRWKAWRKLAGIVFPTHVGVFLLRSTIHPDFPSLPHARGGVSKVSRKTGRPRQSSPRTWGCFPSLSTSRRASIVFPTHVGVFLVRG